MRRLMIIKDTNNIMKYIVPGKVWHLSEDIVNIFTLYK